MLKDRRNCEKCQIKCNISVCSEDSIANMHSQGLTPAFMFPRRVLSHGGKSRQPGPTVYLGATEPELSHRLRLPCRLGAGEGKGEGITHVEDVIIPLALK